MNTSQKFAKYVTSSVLGMVGLSCYILADTYFVSAGVGGLGLAALNIAIPIFSLISGTGLMAGIGAASRFTALRAAKDKNAENIFTNICAFGMAAGVLITLLGFVFSEEICLLLGADTETLAYTDEYLKTLMCTSLLFIMNNILTAFVRNDGNPRLSMAAMLIGSFANILLDYLFIFPLGLGMFGAAAGRHRLGADHQYADSFPAFSQKIEHLPAYEMPDFSARHRILPFHGDILFRHGAFFRHRHGLFQPFRILACRQYRRCSIWNHRQRRACRRLDFHGDFTGNPAACQRFRR